MGRRSRRQALPGPLSAARTRWASARAERDKFIQKQALPIFDGTQEYCLWLGCMGGYDPKGREIVADFARVMNYLGTSYGVLRKEKCTGDPVRRLGNDLVFQQLAEANLEALAQNKVKKIVSICPHCVRTIQEDWKEYGTPPEIEHHSEFLAARTSCRQSKGAGENRLPRSLLPGPLSQCLRRAARGGCAGRRVVEAPRNRERSFCCGAGGGLAFLGEETGERVSHNRAAELVATGATTMGAACPFCNTMFRDALARPAKARRSCWTLRSWRRGDCREPNVSQLRCTRRQLNHENHRRHQTSSGARCAGAHRRRASGLKKPTSSSR
jgi:Fe-S oxidoreductase